MSKSSWRGITWVVPAMYGTPISQIRSGRHPVKADESRPGRRAGPGGPRVVALDARERRLGSFDVEVVDLQVQLPFREPLRRELEVQARAE